MFELTLLKTLTATASRTNNIRLNKAALVKIIFPLSMKNCDSLGEIQFNCGTIHQRSHTEIKLNLLTLEAHAITVR